MRNLRTWLAVVTAVVSVGTFVGCDRRDDSTAAPPTPAQRAAANVAKKSLRESRDGFTTKLTRKQTADEIVAVPPSYQFQVVKYDSKVGPLAAYLTSDPGDGKKHPAIIWITGGDCNTIGDVWTRQMPDNDQTAIEFRRAGIVTMFPSLRGGNTNPGVNEAFYGELDDVVAAANFLAKQPYVDPQRIYLGGHSTGGTMALLTAEYTDRFRATFSFGPVVSPVNYGIKFIPYDQSDKNEVALRSPGNWLDSIHSPVFVFEGADEGNGRDLLAMKSHNTNPIAQFFLVKGGNHFSVLFPVTGVIAKKINEDTGPACNISFDPAVLNQLLLLP